MGGILSSSLFITIAGGILVSLFTGLIGKYLLNRRPPVLKLYRRALDHLSNGADLNLNESEKHILKQVLRDPVVIKTIRTRVSDPGPEAQQLLQSIARLAIAPSRLAEGVFASKVVSRLLYAEISLEETEAYQHFYNSRRPYFDKPAAPTGLSATVIGNQIILTWIPVQHPGIYRYCIKRSTGLDEDFVELGNVLVDTGNLLRFTDERALASGTRYYYTVLAESSVFTQGHLSTHVFADYKLPPLSNSSVEPELSHVESEPLIASMVLSSFFTSQEIWKEIASKSVDRIQDVERLLTDFDNPVRRLILIEGFGGLGKTTLAARLADAVSKRYTVLWVGCQGIPVTAERLLHEMGRIAADEYKYPYLRAIIDNPQRPQEEKDSGLLDFLAFASKSKNDLKPVAFFFDDYHLATDAALKRLVLRIAESSRDVKIVLILRYLPSELQDEVDASPALQLRGLDVEGCRELIGQYVLNYPALKNIDREQLERIWELTGKGVPAALRILISLTRKLSLDDVLEELPTLTAATRKKWFDKLFYELSPDEQRVASEASIFRRPISRLALITISSCERAKFVIDSLVDRFVLTFDGKHYSMHALWSDYTAQHLSAQEAKELHRKVAIFYRDYVAKDRYVEVMNHLESCYHFIKAEEMEQAEQELILVASTLLSWGFLRELNDVLVQLDKHTEEQNKRLNPALSLEKSFMLNAQGFVDESIQILNELVDTETGEIKIKAIGRLAWTNTEAGRRREAERLFEQSMQLARQLGMPKLEGDALWGLYHIALLESDYDKAQERCQQRLQLYRKLQNDPETQDVVALIYGDMGNVYREQGLYNEAMQIYRKNLEILHTRGDPPLSFGWLIYDIGQILFAQKKWQEAQNKFEEALHCFEKIQFVHGIAHAKIELGRVGSKISPNYTPINLVQEAITLLRRIKLATGEAYGLRALGEIYLEFGEPDSALPYLQQSLEMDEKILHGVKGIASSMHLIGLAYEQQAKHLLASANPAEAALRFRAALSTILRAKELFTQLHAIANYGGILDDIARIEQECAEYDKTTSR